jgi:hypothetical protein
MVVPLNALLGQKPGAFFGGSDTFKGQGRGNFLSFVCIGGIFHEINLKKII